MLAANQTHQCWHAVRFCYKQYEQCNQAAVDKRDNRAVRARHDPNQANIVVSPSRPGEALAKSYSSAKDGFTYRFKMVMAEGRPYSDVNSTLAFPGPFTLVTPEPAARPPAATRPSKEASGVFLRQV